MKTLLLFAALVLSINVFGQSKKEQIITLNNSIDSLNAVLVTTRDNSTKEIGSLNDKVKEVSDEVTALKSDLTNLQTSNVKLTKENEKLKTDLEEMSKKNLELEAKLKAIEEETSPLSKEDLLVWLYENLDKHFPYEGIVYMPSFYVDLSWKLNQPLLDFSSVKEKRGVYVGKFEFEGEGGYDQYWSFSFNYDGTGNPKNLDVKFIKYEEYDPAIHYD